MLSRLPPVLFWFAAIASLMALFGPQRHATVLTAASGIALLVSLALWRLGLARAAQTPDDAEPPAARLESAGLVETASRIAACAGAAASWEDGLHGVARVLRNELGAQRVAVHEVIAIEPPLVRLAPVIDGRGLRGSEHRVRLDLVPLGQAVRDARPAGQPPGPFALPVMASGTVLALVELAEIALEAEPAALQSLFALAGVELAALYQRLGPAAGAAGAGRPASEDPVTSSRSPVTPAVTPGSRTSAFVADNPGRQDGELRPPGPGLAGPVLSGSEPLRLMPRPDSSPAALAASGEAPAPGAAPAGTVLDAAALARLRELDPTGNSKLLERVFGAFETSLGRLLPQLDEARAKGDLAGIRHVAHTLKSSSASIGALQLSQQCAEIEAAARQGIADGLDPKLDAAVAEIRNVQIALRRLMDTGS